jgi:hypothetical protein
MILAADNTLAEKMALPHDERVGFVSLAVSNAGPIS